MPPRSVTLFFRTRVLVATRYRLFTRGLELLLRAQGAQVRPWGRPLSGSTGGRRLEKLDVLLIVAHGLDKEEWALLDRARERSPLTEIIAIASDPLNENAVQALCAGPHTLLTYPVSDEQVLDAIADAIERKRRREERIAALWARARDVVSPLFFERARGAGHPGCSSRELLRRTGGRE